MAALTAEAHKRRRVVDGRGPAANLDGIARRGSFDLPWAPSGLAVSADGTIYVSYDATNSIQCFDSRGHFLRQWGSEGSGDGEFRCPRSLAVRTAVAQRVFSASLLALFPALATWPPGLWDVCLVYADDDLIYVADSGNHRIQLFEASTGAFLRKTTKGGQGAGEDENHLMMSFHCPVACALGPIDGLLYIADSANGRVVVMDSFCTAVSIIQIARCVVHGVAVGLDGSVFVSTYDSILRLGHAQSAGWVLTHRWSATSPGHLVFDDSSNTLYVTNQQGMDLMDPPDDRISHFTIDGVLIDSWCANSDGVGYGSLGQLALGPSDVLYAADGKNRRLAAI